ncbi:V-type ATP synthase subunit I [Methanoculleus horonobensis]|jgi:V/A-type H+-transporting ATPase subunit I|uniref:V-type ATP synthase subunit I n=1 Tax=Methanoculleus horonobensis TaxID=528314 RepID=UPI00082BBBAC|nr:V-type ATP synthase subunit I [Methanoculleus horonobensis]MDD3070537.1 V-type ATP synthase subunit I [Methanoculleus horonobensis]MDD4251836.1 V-type ATP synthase subunit I [Methanoculleus horonobensis]
MLRPERMRRLLIAAPKGEIDTIIRELYRYNVYHIEDFVPESSPGALSMGHPLPEASDAASALIKVRAIENACGIDPENVEGKTKLPASKVREMIRTDLPAIQTEAEGLVGSRSRLETRQKEHEQRARELEPFTAVPLDLEFYRGYTRFTVFTGHITHDVEIDVPNEKYFSDKVAGNMIVVVVQNEHREEVERTLLDAGFQAIPVPEETGAPADRMKAHLEEALRIEGEVAAINGKIAGIRERHTDFLVACDELLTADVERAEAPLRFATTEETFLTEGWIPEGTIEEVKEALIRVTGGKIYLEDLEIEHQDEVPVKYKNPGFAQPSQMFMDLYSHPQYAEVDPTLMVSIVFPIFFGMILGDVGYGLILLALSLGLRKFFKGGDGRLLLVSLRNASIVSVIFGLLYSEIIGYALPWAPIIYSRHLNIGGHASEHGAQVAELLIVSIWIGILHISLGRILGIINARNLYHGKHATQAILSNAGWLGVMWGIILMIWSMYAIPLMPDLSGLPAVVMGFNLATVIGAVLLVGGIIAIAQENVLEIIEIPTIISHVLSYARLAAVGLSSVAIAMVVNYIAIELMISPQLENLSIVGVVIIIVGIIVFLLGHVLNTALGILGGGLNAIRLHYVEFFTKFYKGGGKKYNPFGMKSKFTEE